MFIVADLVSLMVASKNIFLQKQKILQIYAEPKITEPFHFEGFFLFHT